MKINSLVETISIVEEEYSKIDKNIIEKLDTLIEHEYCFNSNKNKEYIINELKDFLPNIEGTEKQVKWAKDRLENNIVTIVLALSSYKEKYENNAKQYAYLKQFNSILLNNALKTTNSKEIIDTRYLKVCGETPYCIASFFEAKDLSKDYLM